MLSRDKSSQPINMSPDETQVILKALSYYQIRLFDEITKQKTQSLTEEITQTTVLIKKIHKFQEDQKKSTSLRSEWSNFDWKVTCPLYWIVAKGVKKHYGDKDQYYRPEEWVLIEVRPHLKSQNSHRRLSTF